MSELYNRIDALCKTHGTNITALCKKAGVGRATLSELNAGRTKTLKLETAQKLADALGVSLNFLQGKFDDGRPVTFSASVKDLKDYLNKKETPTPEGERMIDDREMKAAFLGGLADGLSDEEIDEYWDDARDYIGYKIQQKKNKSD